MGGERANWSEGKSLIFDDTYEHHVWNDTGRTRVVLFLDVMRPTRFPGSGINQAVAKNPAAISFPTEIHRDGPGHLAIVDLPHGVEASEVCARRGKLASGLRLPMDQVWPEPVPRAHTGRLALWVGYEPASAMKQPAWPLLREAKVDVFKPFPFATDPRNFLHHFLSMEGPPVIHGPQQADFQTRIRFLLDRGHHFVQLL